MKCMRLLRQGAARYTRLKLTQFQNVGPSKALKAPADAAISSKHPFVPAASSAEKDTENSGRIAESDQSQHSGASCDHQVHCRVTPAVVQNTAVMSTCSCVLDVC
jgi:hypothetical protein